MGGERGLECFCRSGIRRSYGCLVNVDTTHAIDVSEANLLYVNKALIRAAPNPVVGGSSNG